MEKRLSTTTTRSNTDHTTPTPHPTQSAVASPPAGSSKPEMHGQPPAARHDQAEIPPERPAKPDEPATMQADRELARQCRPARGIRKMQEPQGPRITGTG